jgi:hypothetical protein
MNPQQILMQMMNNSRIANNPMVQNLVNMARSGNAQGIEQIGRNMAKERGVDFDKAFSEFRSQFGMK